MRPVRTQYEQRAIQTLVSELTAKGHVVEEDPAVIDKPDALLILDGVRVAVECRIFSPERLLKLHDARRWEDVGLSQVLLPIEPHVWIRHAIDAKAALVAGYKERTNASRVWLLCHFGTHLPVPMGGDKYAEFFTQEIAAGIESSNNKFDEIYIVDERAQQAVACVFRERRYQVRKELRTAFPLDALPVSIFFYGRVKPVFEDDGRAYIRENLQEPHRRVVMQPLDKRFRLREKDVAAIDLRNIGNGRNFPTLKAYRVSD